MQQNTLPNAVFGCKFRTIYYSLTLVMLMLAIAVVWWLFQYPYNTRPHSYYLIYLTVFSTLGYLIMLAMIPIKAVRFLHCFYKKIGKEPPKPLPSLRKFVAMLFIPLFNFLWFFKILYDLNFLLNYSLLHRPEYKNKVTSGTFKALILFLVLAFVFALICYGIIYLVLAEPRSKDCTGRLINGLIIMLYGSIFSSISLLFLSLGFLTFTIIINTIIRLCNHLQTNGATIPSVTKPVLVLTIVILGLQLFISTIIIQFFHYHVFWWEEKSDAAISYVVAIKPKKSGKFAHFSQNGPQKLLDTASAVW